MLTNNKDAGIIDTDFKFGTSDQHYYYAGGQRRAQDMKWRLKIRVLKLAKDLFGEKSQVRIEKEEWISPGPLEAFAAVPSNGYLEKAILYRIGRLIELEKKLNSQ
ncbi:MAG: hypothetical protein HY390_01495 [Deltaproteobacteria bacterium]|nr:hypothetical protein [Deltaproteobacteria bacterium]